MVESEPAARPDRNVGEPAPHVELLDDHGQLFRLVSLQGEHSAVLYFARSFG